MKSSQILFISHDASRTGASIVFLNFLKWFKANSNNSFQILLRNGGVLEPEFEAIAPVTIFNQKLPKKRGLITKLLSKMGFCSNENSHLKHLKERLIRDNIGLIYTNTVTNGEVLIFLSDLNCPIICHVHELEWTIRHNPWFDGFQQMKERTRHYIAVSEAVKTNLIENHDIAEDKIDMVYGFIPIPLENLNQEEQIRKQLCAQLSIPQEAKIICASGTIDWRKGPDLFVQLARAISEQYFKHPVYFLWVGGETEGPCFIKLCHDVKKIGLEKFVHFLGVQPNPLDYFIACDVFTLVSREDPFPLVCLEAASVGKPILCFDRAGGAPEFVEEDCGFIVPYSNIQTMADKTIKLLESAELRQRLGQRGAQKVRERHTLETASPKLQRIIEKIL